jgi:hypothetical protein
VVYRIVIDVDAAADQALTFLDAGDLLSVSRVATASDKLTSSAAGLLILAIFAAFDGQANRQNWTAGPSSSPRVSNVTGTPGKPVGNPESTRNGGVERPDPEKVSRLTCQHLVNKRSAAVPGDPRSRL